jgi:CRP-like cAMP-binding protein
MDEKEILASFLDQFTFVSEQDKLKLTEKLKVKTYPKGTILQNEGEIPQHCFFVLKGAVRQYQLQDGLDKTTEFYTPDNGSVSPECYINQSPSEYFLETISDSVLMIGEKERDTYLVKAFPVLEKIMRVMMEREWGSAQTKLALFKLSSPEERYLNLLNEQPELMEIAPLHQIASYLGMTPESLSRIRKRIASRVKLDK